MATKKKSNIADEAAPPVAAEEVIESVKGFSLDWKCRGFRFELGKTYEHQGKVKACASGFHACENPLDVFGYYSPGTSRFATVKQSGILARHGDDTKIASAKITIEAELKLPDLIDRAVKWVFAHAKPADTKHAEGYQSAASSTGYQSAASSTGYRSAASSTGYRSAASSTGYQSAASSTGYRSAASSTGYQSAASSTGDQSAAMSSGLEGRAMGAKGCALFLVYRDPYSYDIKKVWAGIAGENGIKPLTWYTLDKNGNPAEAES
jgi:hypothetical protein